PWCTSEIPEPITETSSTVTELARATCTSATANATSTTAASARGMLSAGVDAGVDVGVDGELTRPVLNERARFRMVAPLIPRAERLRVTLFHLGSIAPDGYFP